MFRSKSCGFGSSESSSEEPISYSRLSHRGTRPSFDSATQPIEDSSPPLPSSQFQNCRRADRCRFCKRDGYILVKQRLSLSHFRVASGWTFFPHSIHTLSAASQLSTADRVRFLLSCRQFSRRLKACILESFVSVSTFSHSTDQATRLGGLGLIPCLAAELATLLTPLRLFDPFRPLQEQRRSVLHSTMSDSTLK